MDRYNVFKGENATLATFGAGFCSFEDSENCVVYINLLDNAVLPIPTCLPDGTFVWPKSQYLIEALPYIFLDEIMDVKLEFFLNFTKLLQI